MTTMENVLRSQVDISSSEGSDEVGFVPKLIIQISWLSTNNQQPEYTGSKAAHFLEESIHKTGRASRGLRSYREASIQGASVK